MRILPHLVLSGLLLAAAQPALANDANAPLAPGKAAGLQAAQTNAQLSNIGLAAAIGLGAISLYLILGTNYHVPGNNGGGHAASGTH